MEVYHNRRFSRSALSYKESYLFPIQTQSGRRDIITGGLALLFGFIFGWILNLGYRLIVVHRLYHDDQPYFRGFSPLKDTFRRGLIAFAAIALYLTPSVLLVGGSVLFHRYNLESLSAVSLALGLLFSSVSIFVLPGGMTAYAVGGSLDVLRSPRSSFLRVWSHRDMYLKAWCISLSAILLSFLGLLFFGIGFFFASVWAWEVVGYVFTVALYSETEDER